MDRTSWRNTTNYVLTSNLQHCKLYEQEVVSLSDVTSGLNVHN